MILITLEGGLVASILSDNPAIVGHEVIVNDYDEGADDYVTDLEGEKCCPHRETVEPLSAGKATEVRLLTDRREEMLP